MPIFTIPFRVTDAEYLAFNDHHFRYTPHGRKGLRRYRLAIILTSLAIVLFAWSQHQDAELFLYQAIGSGIVVTLGCCFFRPLMIRCLPSKIKKARKNGQYLYAPEGEYQFDFDSRTIWKKEPKAETQLSFDTVEHLYETDTAFYLYVGPNHALLIPYHCFAGTDQLAAFREQVRATFPH